MKEHSDILSQNLLNQYAVFPGKNQQAKTVSCLFRRAATSLRGHLGSGLAATGIGIMLLGSIYLFFVQLAEYGW